MLILKTDLLLFIRSIPNQTPTRLTDSKGPGKLITIARAAAITVSMAGAVLTSGYASANIDLAGTEGCSYRDAAVNDGWGYNPITGASCQPRPEPGMEHLVIQLRGTATAVLTDYDTDGDGIADTTAPCFDAALFNPATGLQIGTGSDCLDVQSNDGGNIALTGTGFFNLADGTIVVQGQTTVRPVLQPTSRGDIEFTHITGANSDGGVLYGTGRFEGASGKVRLSGQVDMSRLDSDGIIHFDCLFVIDFS